MLRNSHTPARAASGSIRAVAVACMVLAVTFVAGLRSEAAESEPGGTIDLSYVLEDTELVIAIRPAAILERAKDAGLDELVKMLARSGTPLDLPLLLEPEEIEQLTFCAVLAGPASKERTQNDLRYPLSLWEMPITIWERPGRGTMQPGSYLSVVPKYFVLRAVEAIQLSKLVPANAKEKSWRGKTYFVSNRRAYFQLDDHTIAMGVPGAETSFQRILVTGPGSGPAFLSQEAWKSAANDYGVITYDHEALNAAATKTKRTSRYGRPTKGRRPIALEFLLMPPMDEIRSMVLGLRLDDHLGILAMISCKSNDGAAKVQETLDAYRVIGRNMLVEHGLREPDKLVARAYDILGIRRLIEEFFDSVKIEQAGHTLHASGAMLIENDWMDRFAWIAMSKQAYYRGKSSRNLQQLAMGMHNYHDRHRIFPPAVLYGPDKKTPYSWRVALLPYIGPRGLYDRYRFDEPWDGPSNLKLLNEMPSLFRHPNAPASSRNSSYFALTGPGTVFSSKEGTRFRSIVDGTANTLLFVEAKRDIPWTKPEDIPYDADKPIPKLGGFTKGGFNTVFCDGHVRFLSETLPEKTLRALISIAGGERISHSDY